MATPPTRPAALLAAAGAILSLAGAAGIAAGLLLADRIFALLPPVPIDAAAVGGATVALGVAAGLLGLGHLALALAVWRGDRRAAVPAVVLSALMTVLAVAWAVAALVSAASATGPPAVMLPAGIGLALAAVAYGWVTVALIGLARGTSRPS